jgi:hypothetical protein
MTGIVLQSCHYQEIYQLFTQVNQIFTMRFSSAFVALFVGLAVAGTIVAPGQNGNYSQLQHHQWQLQVLTKMTVDDFETKLVTRGHVITRRQAGKGGPVQPPPGPKPKGPDGPGRPVTPPRGGGTFLDSPSPSPPPKGKGRGGRKSRMMARRLAERRVAAALE